MPMITEKYAKMILSKVSFDKTLFKKELEKTLNWLGEHDRIHIKEWVKKNYPSQFLTN